MLTAKDLAGEIAESIDDWWEIGDTIEESIGHWWEPATREQIAALVLPLLERAWEEWVGPRISRCAQCGTEGGAVFLVCAGCWAPQAEKRDA